MTTQEKINYIKTDFQQHMESIGEEPQTKEAFEEWFARANEILDKQFYKRYKDNSMKDYALQLVRSEYLEKSEIKYRMVRRIEEAKADYAEAEAKRKAEFEKWEKEYIKGLE